MTAMHTLLLAVASVPWMPPNGSQHGRAVDHLMYVDLVALGICFLLAHALLLIAIFKRRRTTTPNLWLIEALPLATLVVLYIWMSVTAENLWARSRFQGANPEALQIEVVGIQFQWYFRYPGPDAAFGVTKPGLVNAAFGNPLGIDPEDPRGQDDWVASEMVLPQGREVDLRLRSLDVIHGLFIPGMRLKQNAVPGEVLHVHFTPEEQGEYPIYCTQVCGLGHGRMQARLRVVSPEEFQLWQQQKEAKARRQAQ